MSDGNWALSAIETGTSVEYTARRDLDCRRPRHRAVRAAGFAKHVTPVERLRVVTSDADDDKILECAVAAGSEIVVTGDAHLLSLGDFSGIRIQRVAEFLAEFQAR